LFFTSNPSESRSSTAARMTGDNDTITLKDAAQHFGFTVWTLRAEAERGRLTIYKIGKRYYTTPADIREMVNQCRVDRKGRDFTLIRGGDSGSSATERASSALAAANETVLRLRNSSRNTSAGSTGQKSRARR
jgi:hypothetical protein